MEKFLLVFCSLLSCFIITYILFQFMDERYHKAYKSKLVYLWSGVGATVLMAALNLLGMPMLNFSAWFVLVAALAGVLYFENNAKSIRRIVECEAFFIMLTFMEAMGVILVKWLLRVTEVRIKSPVMATCLEVTVSKVVVIFLYYIAVRGFIKESPAGHSKMQSVTYFVILLYSFVNTLVIIQGLSHDLDNGIFAINMCCIVLADLYLLYFIKMTDEKKSYHIKVRALEQQAKLQYEYYLQQEQKYNQTIQTLHDVNRHIQSIKELCVSGNTEETKRYAEQIGGILKPLIPTKYTGNAILDILLSDKVRQIEDKGISFFVDLDGISFDFMEAIDITTIFGNLLDNALEACEAIQDKPDKGIVLTAKKIQEMVSVTVENDCNPVKWRADIPVSEKGENRGIGLLNVRKSIDRYDGNLKLRENNGKFIAEFFLNT